MSGNFPTTHYASVNKEYGYYDNGLLQSKNWLGNVTAYIYDENILVVNSREIEGAVQANYYN